MTRLDHNRALSMLSKKLGCHHDQISKVAIWGNHSSTQFADTFSATVGGESLRKAINDDEFLDGEFLKNVAGRGAEIIKVMNKSSAASAAASACDHMHDWWFGTKDGNWVSMGVITANAHYGIDTDLCFSYPVTIENGQWTIVKDIDLTQFQKDKLETSMKELQEERMMALGR